MDAVAGRIGPNAVLRLMEAVRAQMGEEELAGVLAAAGLSRYAAAPPTRMTPQDEVARLYAAAEARWGEGQARRLAARAGELTADYLVAKRIPWVFAALLSIIPGGLASRLLIGAIRRHAWTFAGSGRFEAAAGAGVALAVVGGPLRAGPGDAALGAFYGACFERMFRVLADDRLRLAELAVVDAAVRVRLAPRSA